MASEKFGNRTFWTVGTFAKKENKKQLINKIITNKHIKKNQISKIKTKNWKKTWKKEKTNVVEAGVGVSVGVWEFGSVGLWLWGRGGGRGPGRVCVCGCVCVYILFFVIISFTSFFFLFFFFCKKFQKFQKYGSQTSRGPPFLVFSFKFLVFSF